MWKILVNVQIHSHKDELSTTHKPISLIDEVLDEEFVMDITLWNWYWYTDSIAVIVAEVENWEQSSRNGI